MRKLEGTLNLTGTQAARADIDAFDFTVNNSADTLDVRFPSTFRLQVGMADVVTGQLTLCTNFANTCHVLHLLNCRSIVAPNTQYKYFSINFTGVQVENLDRLKLFDNFFKLIETLGEFPGR